jgi:hypothetical protein
MTLQQYVNICERAIAANFRCRNNRVFSNELRHQRILLSRRNQVRGWIKELKMATDPATSDQVAAKVFWQVA